uniref:CDP-glucose 4,6-dehydratase n=1 Tax=Candidatus Kentrum sp. SD TaxID=2126332 RepID=A0A451BK95_9GAMM|nr:MAG: CDP-glucose 4,6-dehydratase [Candidatus Kentron sp. SD]VFK48885.1 MAG: CDP-glucose 4,6-dehydratase [Candidatus Kentron sp. SD]VFK78714.1 MAG: CDP-glucose 4,6-dehydratase [Candidatus Kentron sp. SD]
MEVSGFWEGKRVFLTGHTGFKGSWLSLWLSRMGAEVHGYALEPNTNPALFQQMGLEQDIDHYIGDVRDAERLNARMRETRPEIVFHLAAQPLVLSSYEDPLSTWKINVMGSINLLEALRRLENRCVVIMVTSDKVYENRDWSFAYREIDRLGGHDPYSSSKAGMELAIESWRRSFFADKLPVRMATARAGNVIGGGDWASDRILPDIARALMADRPIAIRNPNATRPWQHVLEPLSGYLRLAEKLYVEESQSLESAFNFGPESQDCRAVRELVETVLDIWPGSWRDVSNPMAPHEASMLALSIDKARLDLAWTPRWRFVDAVRHTIDWYQSVNRGTPARDISLAQIHAYTAARNR